MFAYILLIATIIYGVPAHASFYERKAEGWFWFEEKDKQDAVPIIEKQQNSPNNPNEHMELVRKKLQFKMNKAMLNPTEENVKDYIVYQHQISNQAQNFSKVWQKVVLTNPELDENLKNPASQLARQVLYSEQEIQEKQKLFKLAKTHGLIYVYGGGCGYCKAFAPIVKSFANRYGFEVIAISADRVISEHFPNSRFDNGITERLSIKSWPTLLALNTKTQEVFPIANGLVSETDMISNVMLLTGEN